MENTQRYCLTLDLKDDLVLIAEYKKYHQHIWPEITKSLQDTGIVELQIYLLGTRLFMILEADETFSFARKSRMDAENAKVQEWEALMWQYQQALPMAKKGEKWLLMEKIFDLKEHV